MDTSRIASTRRALATTRMFGTPRPLTLSAFVCICILAAACGILGLGGPDPFVGLVEVEDVTRLPEVPDSVSAGEPFTVTVQTFGSKGCGDVHHTEVVIEGNRATITPYDIRRDGFCSGVGAWFEHRATVVFGALGPALVIVEARDLRTLEPISLEYPVIVY